MGEDQKQHLELTRDIAQSFNSTYGVDYFPLPEPQIFGSATRVMSLRDGTKKMSKSDESDYSRINMIDGADEIEQKIRKARTDPDPLPESVEGLAERPEALNLVSIYAALEDVEIDQVIQEYQGQGFSTFKKALADLAVARLDPVSSEMKRLTAEPGEIDQILADGADRAAQLSRPIVAEVREIMGFLDPNRS